MNLENVKDKLKKFKEINKYNSKEKPNLWILVQVLYMASLVAIFHINLNSFSLKLVFLIIITYISFSLTFITLIKIENYRQKHKDSFFDKFLNKFEKFKSFLNEKNIIKLVFLHIFRIFVVLFILITFIIINFFTNYSGIALTLALISSLILTNSIISFIADLISLVKGKIKKFNKQNL